VYAPLARAQGEKLSIGVITSSGALSTVIPPSIMLIVFGIATDVSITSLFMAGILPGIVLVIVVSIYLWRRCAQNAKLGLYESEIKPKATAPEVKKVCKEALPVIFLPVIILGGIYCGLFTPTEAAAVSAVYSLIVAVFILRDIPVRMLPKVLIDACRVTGQTFLLVAVSTLLAQVMTMAQIPGLLTESFASLDKITFLLMLNILLLIVGCLFDTAAAILVLAPLFMPAALVLGIDPVHLGIVFSVNLSIGMFTPPFGMNIFVAQSILEKPFGVISRAVAPYIALYVIGLFIITYVPQIALFLPGLLL
jgi:C4-dicarboxylate transporter DctM subunit